MTDRAWRPMRNPFTAHARELGETYPEFTRELNAALEESHARAARRRESL